MRLDKFAKEASVGRGETRPKEQMLYEFKKVWWTHVRIKDFKIKKK